MTRHVVVVGGGYAGTLAALRLGRGGGARVTLVEPKATFTQRIRNHEILAGRVPATFAYRDLLGRAGVAVVQARAEALDAAAGVLTVVRADGREAMLPYDGAVLALGSRTRPAPGPALTLDDPRSLRLAARRLAEMAPGGRILVAGGGLTAIEAAAETAHAHPHLRVVMVSPRPPGSDLSPAGAAHLARALARLGVQARPGVVAELAPGRAVLEDGTEVPFDLAIWAGGFTGAPLAREAGLPVDGDGRARVDGTLTVAGHPELVAAGDAAAATLAGGTLRMGCVTAMPMAVHAAETLRRRLRGEEPAPFRFGFPGRNISLGRRDGVVQLTTADDAPTGRVLTGRAAAVVKETVLRGTFGVLRGEARLGLPLYAWRRGFTAQAVPALLLEAAHA